MKCRMSAIGTKRTSQVALVERTLRTAAMLALRSHFNDSDGMEVAQLALTGLAQQPAA